MKYFLNCNFNEEAGLERELQNQQFCFEDKAGVFAWTDRFIVRSP
jgi:hypothetical protein